MAAITVANTGGERAAQTKSALSGRPGRGRMVAPARGGPGLKRNDLVRFFQRWTRGTWCAQGILFGTLVSVGSEVDIGATAPAR